VPALDDDQERRGDSCISAKEKPWRTAWRARLAAELDDERQSRASSHCYRIHAIAKAEA
jgi:hypothetical protein